MSFASAKLGELVEKQAGIYVKTTETKPILSESDIHTACIVIDDVAKTVVEIWVWSGYDWYKL